MGVGVKVGRSVHSSSTIASVYYCSSMLSIILKLHKISECEWNTEIWLKYTGWNTKFLIWWTMWSWGLIGYPEHGFFRIFCLLDIQLPVSYIKMEGNRDESERCFHLANKYLSQGDLEKAKKFLNKAERLFPTEKAKGKYSNILRFTTIYTAEIRQH